MNNKENKIALEEVVKICNDYNSGKLDDEDLDEFGQRIAIRPYISILEKSAGIMLLTTQAEYSDTDNISQKIAEMYMNKFFHILLDCYTNIEINDELVTLENYDLISPLLKDFILQYCKNDYAEFNEMLKDTLQVGNLEELIGIFNRIDVKNLEKANQSLNDTFKQLQNNEDLIGKLSDIASFNDPLTSKVVNEIKKKAVKKSTKKTRE